MCVYPYSLDLIRTWRWLCVNSLDYKDKVRKRKIHITPASIRRVVVTRVIAVERFVLDLLCLHFFFYSIEWWCRFTIFFVPLQGRTCSGIYWSSRSVFITLLCKQLQASQSSWWVWKLEAVVIVKADRIIYIYMFVVESDILWKTKWCCWGITRFSGEFGTVSCSTRCTIRMTRHGS